MTRTAHTEYTAAGEQGVMPGVQPLSLKAYLEARLSGPLTPRRPQKACDIGLFDEDARHQLTLF